MNLVTRPRLHARPGTAVREKGRQRRDAILDAATRLLIEDGYAQLSTRKIAARAAVRPGHLQYYYRTKADVVRALLERYLERSLREIEARIAAAGGVPAARLRAMLDGILDDQDRPAACRMFWEIWALAARDAPVARAAAAFYARYRQGVAEALRAAAPGLGPARAERRAALLVSLLEGLTIWRLAGGRRAPLDAGLLRELRALLTCFTEEER
jgi:AcrR family transcriptional regulator